MWLTIGLTNERWLECHQKKEYACPNIDALNDILRPTGNLHFNA